MDKRADIRDFLSSRRARLSPERAGLPPSVGNRRVLGLRREEVAHLAGVSVDYYTRLERGKTTSASPQVLAAIARALQLDDAEREHLFDLIRPARDRQPRRRASRGLRVGLQQVLDSQTTPAIIQDAALNHRGANAIGRALYSFPGDPPRQGFNHALFLFLDPRAREFFRDWDLAARNSVALLRAAAGHDPHDPDLTRVVGQLTTRSEDFSKLWTTHDVLRYHRGTKRYAHPVVGDLDFEFESFEIRDEPGLVMLVYTAEVGSPTEAAVRLLGSWAATEAASPIEEPPIKTGKSQGA